MWKRILDGYQREVKLSRFKQGEYNIIIHVTVARTTVLILQMNYCVNAIAKITILWWLCLYMIQYDFQPTQI